jgi:ABC-type lipoprotein release transport system permease subunit
MRVSTWIEKQRNIIDFTVAAMARRKGKNLALLTVFTLVVALLASVIFFTGALKKEANLVLREAPEVIVQRQIAGRQELIPIEYAERIKSIRGVVAVKPRLWGYYYMAEANYTLMTRDEPGFSDGRVAIGQGISRALQLKHGDVLAFRGSDGAIHDFDIKGVLPEITELVSADLILMSPKDFRNLFGLPGDLATDLTVNVRNPLEVTTVAEKIAELLPDTRPIVRDEIARTYDAVFDWRSGVIVIILVTTLFNFAIFAFDKASGLSAEERREIGTLKAIGWETGDIIVMKVWEALVVSVSAFILGSLLAYAHVFFASATIFEQVLKGWSVLYPEFRLTPFISPYEVATLFFLSVVPYIVATIIPSWKASIVDPDLIMRA